MAKWTPKDKQQTEETNGSKSLPQLLEQEGEWTKRAVYLSEMGHALKAQIGEKADEGKGKDGHGLLGKLSGIEDELRLIQIEHDLAGLRHNNTVFRCVTRDGRESLNQKQLRLELAERGVDLGVINEAWEAATKKGEAYWVREWKELE